MLSVSVVLQGTSSLPNFMNFDATAKILTVTPGTADHGSYTLSISYLTIFDGMAPSLKLKSYGLSIYRLEIGSGTIAA